MSGQDALDLVKLAETNGIRYCLILTDISMPQMNGIELTQLIRKYYS